MTERKADDLVLWQMIYTFMWCHVTVMWSAGQIQLCSDADPPVLPGHAATEYTWILMQAVFDSFESEKTYRSYRTAGEYIAGLGKSETARYCYNIMTVPILANYKTFCRQQRLAQLQQSWWETGLKPRGRRGSHRWDRVLLWEVLKYPYIPLSRLPLIAHVLSDVQLISRLQHITVRHPVNFVCLDIRHPSLLGIHFQIASENKSYMAYLASPQALPLNYLYFAGGILLKSLVAQALQFHCWHLVIVWSLGAWHLCSLPVLSLKPQAIFPLLCSPSSPTVLSSTLFLSTSIVHSVQTLAVHAFAWLCASAMHGRVQGSRRLSQTPCVYRQKFHRQTH